MRKLILAALCAGVCLSSHAGVVTSLSDGVLLPMPSQNLADASGTGPHALADGVVWSSELPQSLFGYGEVYGFDGNGSWSGLAMAALNNDTGSMQLAFDKPVAAVGALFNYAYGHGTASIAAYDAHYKLIDTLTITDRLPDNGVNQGVFYGIRAGTPAISYFVMTGGYIAAANFTVTAVPEPASYALLLAGLGLLGYRARQRRL